MAIKVLKTSNDAKTDYSIVQFQCDTEDDVENLPTTQRVGRKVCAAGSKATVLNPAQGKSPCRVLTEAGTWIENPERIFIDCGTPETAH